MVRAWPPNYVRRRGARVGRLAVVRASAGGGGTQPAGYSAEALTLFAAMTSGPNATRKGLINDVFSKLIDADVLPYLDCLEVQAAGNEHDALLNWVNPGTYDGTNINGAVFTVDAGFVGGDTKYIDSNFNPTTAPSPHLVRDDACIFGWANTSAAIDGALVGQETAQQFNIFPRHSNGSAYYRVSELNGVNVANAEGKGFYAANRAVSTTVVGYKNGVEVVSGASTSAALTSATLHFLRESTNYYTGVQLAGGFGSNLDATKQLALYDALHTYMQAVAGVA